MEDVAYTKERDRIRVRVIRDEDAPNPRKEFDGMGHMACWHSRYDLGDADATQGTDRPAELLRRLYYEGDGFESLPDYDPETAYYEEDFALDDAHVEQWIEENYIVMPLFLYDHSGITISTSSGNFRAIDSAGWDWGLVGIMYLSKAEVIKEYGAWNAETVAKATQYMEGEVREYDAYLRGDVYGIVVDKVIPCHCGDPDCDHNEGYEQVDALWGIFDTNNGDYIREEMKGMLPTGFEDLATGYY